MLTVVLAAIGAPAAAPAEPTTTTPPIQIQVVERGGFHWHDAAVGSFAAIGLTLIVGGLAFARKRE